MESHDNSVWWTLHKKLENNFAAVDHPQACDVSREIDQYLQYAAWLFFPTLKRYIFYQTLLLVGLFFYSFSANVQYKYVSHCISKTVSEKYRQQDVCDFFFTYSQHQTMQLLFWLWIYHGSEFHYISPVMIICGDKDSILTFLWSRTC